MTNTLNASTWQRDDDAYDPEARVRQFTFDGRQFTAHSLRGGVANQWPMTVREAVSQRYVATVSNWTALPGQLSARLDAEAPQSGYTPCACRDCMDVTVSGDVSNPELCSDCKDAGCEPFPRDDWKARVLATVSFECQRDNAYEG